MADFTGDSGDNSIVGGAGGDAIDFSQGGEDTVLAGGGDDTLAAGAALDTGDHIDGGDGTGDVLHLDGDYSLVFTDTTVTDVEFFILGAGHDYDLTLADATAVVQGEDQLRIYASELLADDDVRVDASALRSDHGVLVFANASAVTLIGGAGDDILGVNVGGHLSFDGGEGNDAVDVSGPLGRHDRLNGGAGAGDQLVLENGGVDVLTGKMAKGFEVMILVNGDFDLTMADGNVGFGGAMQVSAANVHVGQHLVFDASAERSGSYNIYAGSDSDTVTGGRGADFIVGEAGDDVIAGGRGGDQLYGDAGADTFVYTSIADSGHHKQFDLIQDLDSSDHIDLSAIDARTDKDGDQAFHIVSALGGHAGELAVSYDSGQNLTVVAGDVDGDGKADITFHIAGDQTSFDGWVL
jgi:Ca2+-binding RTX toxin-like protein